MAFGSSRGCRLPTTIDLHHVCVERRARPVLDTLQLLSFYATAIHSASLH